MKYKSTGILIRNARKQIDLKQTVLAKLVGIDQPRLSQLELGKRQPDKAEWTQLRDRLPQLPATPPNTTRERPAPSKFWRVRQPALLQTEKLSARAFSASKRFGRAADEALSLIKSRADAEACLLFLQQACTDSADEHFFFLQLLAQGANPRWYAPIKAGFRSFCVVDRKTRKNISDLRLPCLEGVSSGRQWLIFPQVTLDARRACYRLDALACVRYQRSRVWLDLEVDGRGHEALFDRERQALLGLVTLRLTTEELKAGNILSWLDAKLDSVRPDIGEAV